MLHARSATLPWCVPARRRLRGAGACAVQAARRIVAAPAGATERPRQPPQARTPVEARRTVLCADAMQWLAQQHELPCVVTSLPDVTELSGPPLNLTSADAYSTWFRQTVALITSKLRRDSVAVFYQTSTQFGGQFIDKSFLCSAGASDAHASQLWHKIALRQDVGHVRFGKLPAFTHVLAYASPAGCSERTPAVGIPDVFHRGDVHWSKAMGIDAAVWVCRFLRDHVGATEVCDPFCGSGTVLAAANYSGMDATGVDISPKKVRHALVLDVYRTKAGALKAQRSTDFLPQDESSSAAPGEAAQPASFEAA